MTKKISFILLDDHPAMLEGLKAILEGDGRYNCVGTASDFTSAKSLIDRGDFELMVTDIRFPDGTGFELAEYSRRLYPERKILFMSMYVSFDYIVKAFRSGATGFISKDAAASALREGADALQSGAPYLDALSLSLVIDTITKSSDTSFIAAEEPYHSLTSREREIFHRIIRQKSLKEIASEFGISPKTVMNHRQNILFKLRMEDDLELKRYADNLGLLDLLREKPKSSGNNSY